MPHEFFLLLLMESQLVMELGVASSDAHPMRVWDWGNLLQTPFSMPMIWQSTAKCKAVFPSIIIDVVTSEDYESASSSIKNRVNSSWTLDGTRGFHLVPLFWACRAGKNWGKDHQLIWRIRPCSPSLSNQLKWLQWTELCGFCLWPEVVHRTYFCNK